MVKYTFKKEERLCNKRLLTGLFQSGSSFILYPYRLTFIKSQDLPSVAQIVISVSKRRFKKSVDRNLLKRRIREAYRLQKHDALHSFLLANETQVLVAIQYIGKTIEPYELMHRRMGDALLKLQHEYNRLYMGTVN